MIAPEALIVVKVPAAAELAPIVVPSIAPALMSAFAIVVVPVSVRPATVVAPLTSSVVNRAVLREPAPIAVPSIAPPLMSAVVITADPVKSRSTCRCYVTSYITSYAC